MFFIQAAKIFILDNIYMNTDIICISENMRNAITNMIMELTFLLALVFIQTLQLRILNNSNNVVQHSVYYYLFGQF